MILFFQAKEKNFIAVGTQNTLAEQDIEKLAWLFGNAKKVTKNQIEGWFVGPRKEMLTPWSTNAVEITQNMGISGIIRIEEYIQVENKDARFDPMLQHLYNNLDQEIFTTDRLPKPIVNIEDIETYNIQ